MPVRGVSSAVPQSRIEALRTRHSVLSAQIEEEQRRPSVTDFYLKQLKKQKLLLKEEIEGLKKTSSA